MAYIREPPLPPLVQSVVVCLFLLISCLWTNPSKQLPSWQMSKMVEVREKGGVGPGERKRDACYKNPLSFVCQSSYWLSHIEQLIDLYRARHYYFSWEIVFKNLNLKVSNLPITLCHKGDMFIFTLFHFSYISGKAVPLQHVLMSHLHKNCYVISYNKFIAILWKILTSWMTTSLFLQRYEHLTVNTVFGCCNNE